MNHRTIRTSAVAMLAAAGFLAGCGDSDKSTDSGSSGSSAEQAAAPTPEENWAKKLCTAIAGQVKELQPPAVEGTDPADTQKALVKFFVEVGDQLEGQVGAIEEVGPPPGDQAKGEFEKAVERMKATETKIGNIRKDLRSAKPDSAADMQKVIAGLSDDMAVFQEYQGPVAELSESSTLGTALTTEPACAKVS